MTAAMDSPDRNPIMPTSDIQGSPFFNFLCSLSPIKQVKLGHGAQTFSELSFPPPPAIFVSPKVENQRNSAPSKRRLLTGATHNAKDKSECDVESSNVEKNSLSWRQATGGCQQIAVTAGTHSIIPCEAALAAEATQVPNDGSSKPEMKVSQCSSGEGSAGIIMLPYDNAREAEGSFEPTHTQHLAFNGNHVKMLDQCAPSLLCETVLDKHKDPSYLSSNDLEKMAASWSLPVEYLSKILASINGTADVVNQTASFESDFPRVNNEPSNLQTAEVVKSEDVDHDCKGTTTGVRRRCLDFETLETQQRALDDLPTLKMLDLSSDNLPCGGFSSNPTAKNKEPASCENNALQYNSIESQNSSAWDHGMHTFSNLNILPQYKRMPDPSIAAYLPLQQSAITNSQVSAPGLSLQVKPTCIGMLNTGLGCSLPGMTSYRPDIIGASGGPPYSARLLPLSGLQVSSSENEQNLLQSTDYTQTEYSGNLDQELLLSLVKRTRMLQHDLLLANSAARLRMAMPTIFYPSFGVGMNPIEETKFSNELESKPTSIMDNSVTHQENSHQSESDHQEDSTLSPRSPRKKRKLLTQTGDSTGEGCKNCKCKKSKCLKLYCECFAAGVYCIDICNCHDCFNKPEFEETVLGTRQQIESRNPLAFLPKIIRASEASPTLGEESMDTPASARHKRGCNCKKSQCLKKYCECYQAGVGCADGCRCEGCKNIYGRNEGTGELEDKDQQNAASEMKITTNDEPTEMDLKHSNEHSNDLQSRDLGPITPYLDNSGQCRSDGELGSAKRLTSPLEHPASTLSLHSPSRLLELLEETENFGQVNLQSYQTASANIVPNHQFSPGWDGQSEIFTPTRPLQQLAPVLSDALLLNKGDAGHPQWQTHNTSSNISSYMSGLTNPDTTQSSLVHQQMVPLNFSPDTNQFETPENGLTVPVTPLPSTSYASRPNYDYEELSEPRPHQSVWFTDDDDSPNVLRELNTFCAPNIITKTRSPQQKRIFSYQRGTGLRNNLSPGLVSRNGRKFILHALPSSGYSEKSRDSE